MKTINLDYSTTLNVPIHYRQLKIITDEIKSKTVSAIILNKCLTENVTHVIKNKLLSMCNNVTSLIETVDRNLQRCYLIENETLVKKHILLGVCTDNSNNSIVNEIVTCISRHRIDDENNTYN